MFNALFDLFMKKSSVCYMANTVGMIGNLLELFEQEFDEDKDARNAAIDAVIQILENHKNK